MPGKNIHQPMVSRLIKIKCTSSVENTFRKSHKPLQNTQDCLDIIERKK